MKFHLKFTLSLRVLDWGIREVGGLVGGLEGGLEGGSDEQMGGRTKG